MSDQRIKSTISLNEAIQISKCSCFALWAMMAVDSKCDMHNKSDMTFMELPWSGFRHLCWTMKLSGSSRIGETPFWVRYSKTYSVMLEWFQTLVLDNEVKWLFTNWRDTLLGEIFHNIFCRRDWNWKKKKRKYIYIHMQLDKNDWDYDRKCMIQSLFSLKLLRKKNRIWNVLIPG